ncbi:MAG: 50S ribosomal protein L16 [Candidatus Cloacimonadota bacterium]|nr:MAG: 50S ribosomal protein L16 [Candidatus Cloacimonadota bacterium]
MLIPRKAKFRKPHKGKIQGKSHRGNYVAFGDFGLQSLESFWMTNQQIEACRVTINRRLKKGGKLWIRIFPQLQITKKPAETRMGKGKGSPDSWVAVIKPGRVIFEVGGADPALAREALKQAAYKLPVKAVIVDRLNVGGEKLS